MAYKELLRALLLSEVQMQRLVSEQQHCDKSGLLEMSANAFQIFFASLKVAGSRFAHMN